MDTNTDVLELMPQERKILRWADDLLDLLVNQFEPDEIYGDGVDFRLWIHDRFEPGDIWELSELRDYIAEHGML